MSHKWPKIDKSLKDQIINEKKMSLNDFREFSALYSSSHFKANHSFTDIFKGFIVNNNYNSYKKLIQLVLLGWRNEIEFELKKSDEFSELFAQSFHYKSPGVGKWFRITDLKPDTIDSSNIFEDDKTIFRAYDQIYTQIPERLNISFENHRSNEMFSFRNIIRIRECDCSDNRRRHTIKKKRLNDTYVIDLPYCCLKACDGVLKGISLVTLLEKSRQKLVENQNNGLIQLPEEIKDLRKYFQKSINSLDILRFILSAYIVIRSSKRLKKIFVIGNPTVPKKHELVIDFYPLNGPISTMKKEGSWILFYSKKFDPSNYDMIQYLDLSQRLEEYWSLLRGSDINGALSIKERYWSLNVERLLSELVCINMKIVENENNLLENILKYLCQKNSKIGITNNAFFQHINEHRKEVSLKKELEDDQIAKFVNDFRLDNPNYSENLLFERLKLIKEFGLLKICGCNELYLNFIEKLRGTSNNGKKDPISIFLYSGPGTGKETISKLIHLWSRSSLFNEFDQVDNLKKFLRINNKDLHMNSEFKILNSFFDLKNIPESKLIHRIDIDNYSSTIVTELQSNLVPDYNNVASDIVRIVKKLKENEAEQSFFSINCSLLTKDNFSKLIFGSIEKPNGMLKAGLYSGSCFFDEFNTIEVGLENNLLKLLVEPNEAVIKLTNDSEKDDVARIQKFNNLYIFASNLTPDELLKKGYNSAVISRITQYYFEIPPLKYRKEDMLLAFISMLSKKIEKNADIGWKMVEPTALQFLCMLPWYGNYRDLDGFVNDLFNERKLRSIFNEELSFREVVECAVRRGLIG
jgi:hypothetical protein